MQFSESSLQEYAWRRLGRPAEGRFHVLCLVLLLGLPLAAAPAWGQVEFEEPQRAHLEVDRVDVHDAPTADSPTVDRITPAAEIYVYAQDGSWYGIQDADGHDLGWIRTRVATVPELEDELDVDSEELTRIIDERDPTTGAMLSFLLTGGGQMYAGRVGKGIQLLLGSLIATGLGVSSAQNTDTAAPLYGTLVVVSTLHIYSIVTAPSDVREYNQRQRERASVGVSAIDTGIEMRPGLTLTVQW